MPPTTTIVADLKDKTVLIMQACDGGDRAALKEMLESDEVTAEMLLVEDELKGETTLLKIARHGFVDEVGRTNSETAGSPGETEPRLTRA